MATLRVKNRWPNCVSAMDKQTCLALKNIYFKVVTILAAFIDERDVLQYIEESENDFKHFVFRRF